jgi:hypothetical protein
MVFTFVENHPIWILEDEPLISEVFLSHASFDRFCLDIGVDPQFSAPCVPQ